MEWTKEAPKEVGVYWYKEGISNDICTVYVSWCYCEPDVLVPVRCLQYDKDY